MNNNINNKKGKYLNYQDKLKIKGFLVNRKIRVLKKIINTKRKPRNSINKLALYLGRSKRTIKRELNRGRVLQINLIIDIKVLNYTNIYF